MLLLLCGVTRGVNPDPACRAARWPRHSELRSKWCRSEERCGLSIRRRFYQRSRCCSKCPAGAWRVLHGPELTGNGVSRRRSDHASTAALDGRPLAHRRRRLRRSSRLTQTACTPLAQLCPFCEKGLGGCRCICCQHSEFGFVGLRAMSAVSHAHSAWDVLPQLGPSFRRTPRTFWRVLRACKRHGGSPGSPRHLLPLIVAWRRRYLAAWGER